MNRASCLFERAAIQGVGVKSSLRTGCNSLNVDEKGPAGIRMFSPA
jgi:hypothetical protein